jgi:hypothetical protein
MVKYQGKLTKLAQSVAQADYVVPVEIDYRWHNVYVVKRPGVDEFLRKMGEIYEVVVFTASLAKVWAPDYPSSKITDANVPIPSTPTPFSINSTSTTSSSIGSSVRAVTTTEAPPTSRTSRSSDDL